MIFIRHFIPLILLTACMHAQSARWDPPGGTLAVGKLDELSLVFEGCSPNADPQPPKVPGLTLVFRGKSQNISMVNFSVTKSITYAYAARLERKEKVEIPPFDVQTDQGAVRVPMASFTPGEATVGQSNVSIEDVAQSKFQAPSPSFWAGEVFPLTYRLDVLRRYFYQLGSHPDWNPAPFVIEEWGKPESIETKRFNESQVSILYRTRAYAKEPGSFPLNAATQLVNIQTGVSGGFLFSQPRYEQIVITSDQPQIAIKPLPLPAPAGFDGAVGQFKFTSKVVPVKARVGEPVTWTLELSGTGNWPDIPGLPSRSVSKSFE
ncbi:MAG: BatD family protein, partial [Opitutaceae bacterium]